MTLIILSHVDIMTKWVEASVRISIRVCYGQKRTLLHFNAAFKPMKIAEEVSLQR